MLFKHTIKYKVCFTMFKLSIPAALVASFLPVASFAQEQVTQAAMDLGMDPYAEGLATEEAVCVYGRVNMTRQVGDQVEGEEALTSADVEEIHRAGRILINLYCPK